MVPSGNLALQARDAAIKGKQTKKKSLPVNDWRRDKNLHGSKCSFTSGRPTSTFIFSIKHI
jgi:hypothetical protein